MSPQEPVTIYTDGGASPNPGPGGWGVVILDANGSIEREFSGGENDSTNNRMELSAAIAGLKSQPAGSSVVIYTDSTYVRNGITKWIAGWIRKNWMRGPKADEPVKNADLWKELHRLDSERSVDWRWLKGHAGHTFNERADELASAAILDHGGSDGKTLAQERETAFGAATRQVILKVRAAKGASHWLALVVEGDEQHQIDGREPGNANRAELRAGLEVLRATDHDIALGFRCGDYFAKGCAEWLNGWKSRGWTTAAGDEVKNKDLWKMVDREIVGRRLSFAPLLKTGPVASDLRRRLKELT